MTCREIAPFLSARTAGPLPAREEERVATHLETCSACRAQAARLDDLCSLLRVPEASAEEERAAAFLPARVLAEARASGSARRPVVGLLGSAVAGAAFGLAVAVGVAAGIRTVRPPAEELVAAAEPAAWQEPDPDEVWEWSGELDVDAEESP